MLTHPREIGGIHTRPEVQKRLAAASRSYVCSICGVNHAEISQESAGEGLKTSSLRVLTGKDHNKAKKKKRADKFERNYGIASDKLEQPITTVVTQLVEENNIREGALVVRRPKLLSIIRVVLTFAMIALSFLGKATISFNISL